MTGRVVLGRVVGHHGLKGWLKVYSFTDPRSGLLDYQTLNFGDRLSLAVNGQRHGKQLLMRLDGCASREDCEDLIGADIWAGREILPDAEPGAFYWHDLEQCEVVTVAGVALGRVDRLMATGANDVLVVKGESELLIPFVQPQVVTAVDLDQKKITVDWDPEYL